MSRYCAEYGKPSFSRLLCWEHCGGCNWWSFVWLRRNSYCFCLYPAWIIISYRTVSINADSRQSASHYIIWIKIVCPWEQILMIAATLTFTFLSFVYPFLFFLSFTSSNTVLKYIKLQISGEENQTIWFFDYKIFKMTKFQISLVIAVLCTTK